MTYFREIEVSYRGDRNDEQVDRYRMARSSISADGWLVVTLDAGRGTYQYPPGSVIKMREFGEVG